MVSSPSTSAPTESPVLVVPRARRRAPRRLAAALGVMVTAAVACWVALSVTFYMNPEVDAVPSSADVIYVIGPPTEERIALARELRSDGVARDILISVPPTGEQSAENLSICQDDHVACLHPQPFTTAGEIGLLDSLYGAGSTAVVITFTPHVSRTRYIAESCGRTDVAVIAAPTALSVGEWVYQFGYQTGGYAKAFAQSCR